MYPRSHYHSLNSYDLGTKNTMIFILRYKNQKPIRDFVVLGVVLCSGLRVSNEFAPYYSATPGWIPTMNQPYHIQNKRRRSGESNR